MADKIDKEFTKLLGGHLLNAKGWYNYGIKNLLTTQEALEFEVIKRNPELRYEATTKMIEGGMSQRKIAKVLGVDEKTIRNDVRNNSAESAENIRSGSTTRELLSQSDQNDWRTPRKYLDAARVVMGGIDLDPASSAEANKTVKAQKFYTEKDNGLEKPWKGKVWLNPPYGGEARLFIERLIKEYQVGNVTTACALLNSHPTETKWFQELFKYTVCFVRGRIDFGGPSREVSTSSTHGSAIAYLGEDVEKFKAKFSEFGAIVKQL